MDRLNHIDGPLIYVFTELDSRLRTRALVTLALLGALYT